MLLLIIVYVYWGLQTAAATAATLRFCFASLSFPEVTPDKLGSWRSPKESYCCCNIFCRPDALPITQPTVSKHWMKVSLSALTAILPGEPGLAGFMEAKDDGSGRDNWSYKSCKAPVKSSPPTNQHPTFYRPEALLVAQPTVSEHWFVVCKLVIQNVNNFKEFTLSEGNTA